MLLTVVNLNEIIKKNNCAKMLFLHLPSEYHWWATITEAKLFDLERIFHPYSHSFTFTSSINITFNSTSFSPFPFSSLCSLVLFLFFIRSFKSLLKVRVKHVEVSWLRVLMMIMMMMMMMMITFKDFSFFVSPSVNHPSFVSPFDLQTTKAFLSRLPIIKS